MTDQPPVLTELFRLLPAPGQPFDPFDRKRWLDACAAVLEVAYPRHVAAIAPVAVQAERPTDAPIDNLRQAAAELDDGKVPCDQCGKRLHPRSMSYHRQTHDRPVAADAPVACDGCGREFANRYGLQGHRARSSCNRPAKLTAAPAPEPEPEPAAAHDTELPIRRYPCTDCTLTFESVLDLDSHRRRFHGLIRAPLDVRATINQDAARRRAAEAI